MSATNVSIRLGVEGKAEIKRAFEEVGQSGQSAFGSVDEHSLAIADKLAAGGTPGESVGGEGLDGH